MPAEQLAALDAKRDAAIDAMHQVAPTWTGDAAALAHHILRLAGITTGPLVDSRAVDRATEWAKVALECATTQRNAEDAGEPLRGLGPSTIDTMLAGRVRKALQRRYRFGGYGVISLGEFLNTVTPTRRSVYTRHYSRKRRNLCYAKLATPAHEYTVWYTTSDGREAGVDIPKIIYDTLDHLPTKTTEQHHN